MFKYFLIGIILVIILLPVRVNGQETNPTPISTPEIIITIPNEETSCKDCPEDKFKTQNFLQYAKDRFSSKFPFDTIGIIGGGSESCNTKENCFLKDTIKKLLNLVKYPVWIGFMLTLIKAS